MNTAENGLPVDATAPEAVGALDALEAVDEDADHVLLEEVPQRGDQPAIRQEFTDRSQPSNLLISSPIGHDV